MLDTALLPALEPHFRELIHQAQLQQQQSSGLRAEQVAQLLPALAKSDLVPSSSWRQLYQAALAASLPNLDIFTLTETLQAMAVLRMPADCSWVNLVLQSMPAKRVKQLSAQQQVVLITALGHLADVAAGDASKFNNNTIMVLWQGAERHLQELEGAAAGGHGAAGSVACDLLRAAGKLQRARLGLGPPDPLLNKLLDGSKQAFADGSQPPASLAQLVRAVEVLGAHPGNEWVDRWVAV